MPMYSDDSDRNSLSPIPPSTDADTEIYAIPAKLSAEAQLKLEVIDSLLGATDKRSYAAKLKEAAVKLVG